MAERFELFRLSLLVGEQIEMFGREYDDFSREDWLNRVFKEEQTFTHYGSDFHYVPATDNSSADIIIGRVGRHVLRDENLPPDEGLEDYTRETWLAALLVLDPTYHDDGQKLAIQYVQNVGKPDSLIRQLVCSINERYPHGPYSIEASQIIEEQSFWDFVKENAGKVTSVTFHFVAPNMFGGDEEFDKEMREFRDSERARHVKLTIQNENGVNPNTPRIRRAANYTAQGGGSMRARAMGDRRYNSNDAVKRSVIDVAEKGIELVKAAKNLADRILGRE